MPSPLDEYPVHQVALPLGYPATSDRNFYDRCYFNAHDRSGDVFLVTGLGVYPNAGVIDAYATVRVGDRQFSVHTSDALGDDRMDQRVGPYRVEVVEPLRCIRLVCDGDAHGVGFDLRFTGSFPAVQEPQHVIRTGTRVIVDGCRFAQVGTWEGVLRVDGREIVVTPDRWVGTRDRSWGIRPVAEPEPPGRWAEESLRGFWWLYAPLRFDDFAIIVILQEEADGTRILSEASRIWPASTGRRPEQLGWPEVDITYRPGTRHPERATIHLTDRSRRTFAVDIETLGSVSLNHGPGYGGPDWTHGTWRGRGWTEGTVHDLTDPAIAAMLPFGTIDHVARATADGAVGWGLFEHATIGTHEPSGFSDFADMAP